jgi:hypothetical protein
MGRVAPGSGQVTVVVEPEDSVELVRSLGPACRRSGRIVGHTSPKQRSRDSPLPRLLDVAAGYL